MLKHALAKENMSLSLLGSLKLPEIAAATIGVPVELSRLLARESCDSSLVAESVGDKKSRKQ